MRTQDVFRQLLDRMLPHRTPPRPAEVLTLYSGAGETKYAADVEVLTPGDWARTGEVVGQVPIGPIWMGQGGQGIYAPPAVGQVVIVECLGWDPAFPYVSASYGETYSCADFKEDELTLTDGQGAEVSISASGLLRIASRQETLRAVIEEIVDGVVGMQTVGSPPQHVVSPATITKLEAAKAKLAQVMEK